MHKTLRKIGSPALYLFAHLFILRNLVCVVTRPSLRYGVIHRKEGGNSLRGRVGFCCDRAIGEAKHVATNLQIVLMLCVSAISLSVLHFCPGCLFLCGWLNMMQQMRKFSRIEIIAPILCTILR